MGPMLMSLVVRGCFSASRLAGLTCRCAFPISCRAAVTRATPCPGPQHTRSNALSNSATATLTTMPHSDCLPRSKGILTHPQEATKIHKNDQARGLRSSSLAPAPPGMDGREPTPPTAHGPGLASYGYVVP
mmetsp:Transcript_11855/g.37868  ORF Transcript_11855/g.37868 Transcript_11855/m.37868 type:complete len:131 (-) Transcript_11855:848-1240(-)